MTTDDAFWSRVRDRGDGGDDGHDLFGAASAFRAPARSETTVRAGKSSDGAPAAATRASETSTAKRKAREVESSSERASDDGGSGSERASESEDEGRSAATRGGARAKRAPSERDDSSDDEREAKKPAGTGYRDRAAEISAEELVRTVFVGNVPATTTTKALRRFFGAAGKVKSARLRNVPVEADGHEPRKVKVLKGKLNAERGNATAFVVFEKAESAQKAAETLNMKAFEGRHVRVDLAAKPSIVSSEVVYDHTRSVFLGHLPFNVDDEDVIRLFNKNEEYPELRKSVEAVRVVRDRKTTMGKGIGFVLFKTKEQARTALLLDGSKLGDREIRVTKTSRSKAPRPGSASKARAEPSPASGAERRNPKLREEKGEKASTGRVTNSWEGSRSRPGGKSSKTAYRGGEARPPPGGIGRPAFKKPGDAKAKRSGKRPAVAARKANAKAKAAAGREK